MHSWFGMDLSSTPFTHHGANQALLTIPYLVLIGMAIFLQYYQMKQMNSRNPQAAAANPQMQQMQKFFPIIFGVIYLRVPAGAIIYMVVSSAMRIGTQEYHVPLRDGHAGRRRPTEKATEREIGGSTAPAEGDRGPEGHRHRADRQDTGAREARRRRGRQRRRTVRASNGKTAANGKPPGTVRRTTNAKRHEWEERGAGKAGAANGKKPSEDAEIELVAVPKEHPRSRSKRTRKAR